MSHLNFPGKIIFQIFRKILGLWLVKSPVKVLSQKTGGESAKLGSKVNHGTEFAPEKMNMKSIEIRFVSTSMTWSIEYKVSFER